MAGKIENIMGELSLENSELSKMSLEKNRVASFKSWPFQDEGRTDVCTAEKMAEAGFYSCSTDASPDLARCYVCFKELEGWEPDDNPWLEHQQHSPKCAFVKKGKPERKLTVQEFIEMEMESQLNRVDKIFMAKVKEVENMSELVLGELQKLSSVKKPKSKKR